MEDMESRREAMLDALDRDFPDPNRPKHAHHASESPETAPESPEATQRRVDDLIADAERQLGYRSGTRGDSYNLTRGEATERRVIELRREIQRAHESYEGGDMAAMESELGHLMDQQSEQHATGQDAQVIELRRSGSRTIHGPRVGGGWYPSA